MRPLVLCLALAACSSSNASGPSADGGGCPYADAAGVTRVTDFPTACTYVCDPLNYVDWCTPQNACTSLDSSPNCGACGVVCAPGTVCRRAFSAPLPSCLPPL